MAERRMFAKTIIDSDAFLDMPLSTQALYFHLSMRADDEGFINNPKKIQRMVGASEDDLKLLMAKNFIIPFDSGIVVIKHWKIHNYIRGDRIKKTIYKEEAALLHEKESGAYTLSAGGEQLPKPDSCRTLREKAYQESSLPYSFEYKIRTAFRGEPCPICGAAMQECNEDGFIARNKMPTIQHNQPISKGGKHELGNISVICHDCNVTIQDKETGDLNAEKVIEVWDSLMSVNCQSSDSQMSAQVRLGKDRLVKVREEDKPTRHKHGEYKNVLLSDEDLAKLQAEFPNDWTNRIERLSSYMASTGKSYKNHLATIRNWAKRDASSKEVELSDEARFYASLV